MSLLDFVPNQPNLSYCPPETARLLSNGRTPMPTKSKAGDVFAFGTLIFLVITGHTPFHNLSIESLLDIVRSGQIESALKTEHINIHLADTIRLYCLIK